MDEGSVTIDIQGLGIQVMVGASLPGRMPAIGSQVKLYTYKVLDSGLGDNVLASLYVCDGCVIGGDVHSTELDGFMGALVSKH